jgi:hypothetical protein
MAVWGRNDMVIRVLLREKGPCRERRSQYSEEEVPIDPKYSIPSNWFPDNT